MDIAEFYKSLPVIAICDQIRFGSLDGYLLTAPESFWYYSGFCNDLGGVINGCGPGGLGDLLIPDRVYGLNIKPACKIHDWMYTIYNDEFGFELANKIFLDNMIRINNSATKNRLLKYLRSRRILKYYLAVRYFGRLFFYDAHIDLYQDQAVYA
jgi:hypothetical protein